MKMTKDETTKLNALLEAYNEHRCEIEDALTNINNSIADLNQHIENANAVIAEINGFAEDIANTIHEYMDEKGEKWQETEVGQNHEAVYNEWSEFVLDEIEELDEIEVDIPNAEAIKELPTQA